MIDMKKISFSDEPKNKILDYVDILAKVNLMTLFTNFVFCGLVKFSSSLIMRFWLDYVIKTLQIICNGIIIQCLNEAKFFNSLQMIKLFQMSNQTYVFHKNNRSKNSILFPSGSFDYHFDDENFQLNIIQMLNKLGKGAIDHEQSGLSQIDQNLRECQDLSSINSLTAKQLDSGSQRNILSIPSKNYQQNSLITNTEDHLVQNRLRSSSGMESFIGLISNQQAKQIANRKTLVRPRRRKGKGNQLKEFMLAQKANMLKDQFLQKIRRNNQYSPSIQYHHEEEDKTFLDRKGYCMREHGQKIISIFSIFNIVSTIFIATLSFVFPEIKNSQAIQLLEVFGSAFFTFEIVINFITLKFSMGKKLDTLREISNDYLHNRFPVDALNLLALLVNIAVEHQFASYLRFFCFLKLQDCVEKLERLQVYFIENYYNEQYWSLVKVFLFNFCFAHMLAIALLAMSNISQSDNWIVKKDLDSKPWFERYIWSYYWGTTIMLTIGFGDIVPSNWQEALCMVFIETISCIVLAYNISCVGTLISNIRSQDVEKSKNLKIFKKLADKHGITESLASKISNYIEEHANIKKLFNIQEQVQLVQKLPSAYRVQYLKEANKKMFQHLFFFNNLMEKTLFVLAEKIEMKITHPQQLILTPQNSFDVFILKHGEVGFISRKINRKFNKFVFDHMKVQQNASPFLLNTNFITKSRSLYGIKSLVYSVLYYLEEETFTETLRETQIDYELYCRMKDKNKNKIDQFQVFPCQFCAKKKHTKFSCPKLHYIPLEQHKIIRYISKEKRDKNQRMSCIDRIQTPKQSALGKYRLTRQFYNQKKYQQQNPLTLTKKLKRQRFILNQLRFLDKQKIGPQQLLANGTNYRSLGAGDDIAKIQARFLEAATQVIRTSINKALGTQKQQDEVWLLDLDRMKNYKDYFPQSNPLNLANLFNVEHRLQKVVENNLQELISRACGIQKSKAIMTHINNLKTLREPLNSRNQGRRSVAEVLQSNHLTF